MWRIGPAIAWATSRPPIDVGERTVPPAAVPETFYGVGSLPQENVHMNIDARSS
jgi:hypothetical protein